MAAHPQITSYGPGTAPAAWVPGDFFLVRNVASWHTKNGFVDAMIRFGQRRVLRGRKDLTKTQKTVLMSWSHAVAVSNGHLVEALGAGVVESPLTKYDPQTYIYVHTDLTPLERAEFVGYVNGMVGTKYGYLTDASIGLSMAIGLRMQFGEADTVICSGLVAAALSIWRWRSNPSFVSPAMLAEYHSIETWEDPGAS